MIFAFYIPNTFIIPRYLLITLLNKAIFAPYYDSASKYWILIPIICPGFPLCSLYTSVLGFRWYSTWVFCNK